MPVNCGGTVNVCRVRVTRVDANGNVQGTTDNSYVTDAVTEVTFSPNVEAGDTISQKNGCGCKVIGYKVNDTFNFFEFSFTDAAARLPLRARHAALAAPRLTDTCGSLAAPHRRGRRGSRIPPPAAPDLAPRGATAHSRASPLIMVGVTARQAAVLALLADAHPAPVASVIWRRCCRSQKGA